MRGRVRRPRITGFALHPGYAALLFARTPATRVDTERGAQGCAPSGCYPAPYFASRFSNQWFAYGLSLYRSISW